MDIYYLDLKRKKTVFYLEHTLVKTQEHLFYQVQNNKIVTKSTRAKMAASDLLMWYGTKDSITKIIGLEHENEHIYPSINGIY